MYVGANYGRSRYIDGKNISLNKSLSTRTNNDVKLSIERRFSEKAGTTNLLTNSKEKYHISFISSLLDSYRVCERDETNVSLNIFFELFDKSF